MTEVGPGGTVRMVVLTGPESPELGRFAIRALAPAVSIAMSAGRLPKAGPSVDPNEDAAFVAVGPAGALAAVVDGHLGFDVAESVVATLKAEAERILVAPLGNPERTLNALLATVKVNGDRVVAAMPVERANSGAALTLALVGDNKLTVATVGDTVALLASGHGRPRRFQRGGRFLRDFTGRAKAETVKLPRTARLVLASDGLLDYTSHAVVADLLTSTLRREPREAAYALLDAALLGGAGDNVTVVCIDLDRLPETEG